MGVTYWKHQQPNAAFRTMVNSENQTWELSTSEKTCIHLINSENNIDNRQYSRSPLTYMASE